MTQYQTPALLKRLIKEKVRDILAAIVTPAAGATPAVYATPAGEKVFVSRLIPTDFEDQTVILIFGTGEQVSRFDQSPKSYRRTFSLRVECIDYGDNDDDLDERLEALGEAVEKVMEYDETLGGLVNKLELSSTEYTTDSEAASPVGLLALTYNVEFFTFPGVLIAEGVDDYEETNVKYRVGHHAGPPDEVTDAEETYTMNEEGS